MLYTFAGVIVVVLVSLVALLSWGMYRTWPVWRWEGKTYCLQCKKLYHILQDADYCHDCTTESELVKTTYFKVRWISTANWAQPWTWTGGKWINLKGEVVTRSGV